ncbi:MAG: universal stress protein [Rhodobacteraceae bacterium]|nr:universal stress protein [Paracoccaceae bacterium]
MYRKIVIPVDLAHLGDLAKAMQTAADLARLYSIPVVYVAVAGTVPDEVARTPEEHAEKLRALAREQGERHGHEASAHPLHSADPQGELNRLLRATTAELGADLVVMASHKPALLDWLLPSHGGSVAEHSEASVFVVR